MSFAAIPYPSFTTHAWAVTILTGTAFADLRHLRFDLRELLLRTDGRTHIRRVYINCR